jgi:pimeloyl-ACP methyl ester carboxylesterase
MAQQARDAVAVIRAMGRDDAYVFGNSGGANIALQLAADHPEIIRGLAAHEGPTLSLLPDADTWLAFINRVHGTFAAHGAAAAFKLFATELAGFDTTPQQARVAAGEMPPNGEFFMAREYLPIGSYIPDLETIRRNQVPMVTAAGRDSADAYYARTARLQAERLRCPYIDFPGNHLGFIFEAETFAATLRSALHDLTPGAPFPTSDENLDGSHRS